jgi:hypothetical protein
LGDKVGKGETRRFRELAGLAKRENATSIESDRKLGTQARHNLRRRQPETLRYGLGYVEMKCHKLLSVSNRPALYGYSTAEAPVSHPEKQVGATL